MMSRLCCHLLTLTLGFVCLMEACACVRPVCAPPSAVAGFVSFTGATDAPFRGNANCSSCSQLFTLAAVIAEAAQRAESSRFY